jgi:hypothetical protein
MLRQRRGRAAALPLMVMLPLAPAGLAQDAPDPTSEASSVEDDTTRQPSASGDAAASEESAEKRVPMDIDTAISGVLTGMMATPRFEEEVVVTDRFQEALNAHLEAAELGCEVARSGPPPSHQELSRYSANPKPPSADLVAPARALAGKASSVEPRFFLYSIRPESAPERVAYVVLDSRVSATMRYSVPETKWELVGEYKKRSAAADALARVERGESPEARPPRTLWAATGCE